MSPTAPTLVVGAILLEGDALVLVRDGSGAADGCWSLPGAAVMVGETLAEAVVRSVADRTGIVALCGPFVGWAEVIDGHEHTVTMYFDTVALGVPDAPAPHEVRAVPIWEVPELRLVPALAEFLADQQIIELVV